MALTTSLRVSVRPDAIHRHEDCVRRLVGRARPDPDSFSWTAYQIVAGVVGAYFYGSEADDWASLTARESTDALTRRLFGEEEGSSLLEQMNNGVTGARLIVFRDRPDLSYFPEQADQPPAFLVRFREQGGAKDGTPNALVQTARGTWVRLGGGLGQGLPIRRWICGFNAGIVPPTGADR